jgi:hypothetical protein
VVLVVAGCSASNAPSSAPASVVGPIGSSAAALRSPTIESSPTPSDVPGDAVAITPPPTPIALPDGLGDQAWATTTAVLDTEGDVASTTVAIGRLGSPATSTFSVPGYARTVPAGEVVLVLIERDSASTIDVYRASDASGVSEIDPGGWVDVSHVAVDPEHEVIYAGVHPAAGGVDIRRIALDGSEGESLIGLDGRFAAQAIPTDHYGLVVATDGRLVVEACADDACRLWRVAPGEAAGNPTRMPPGTAEVCDLAGATDDWLVASDEDLCYLDVAEAPFPWRSIALGDGASRPLTDRSQVGIARLLKLGGNTVAVADRRSGDWSTTDVETYDVPSGKRHVIVERLDNDADADDSSGWLGVSPQVMPGSWVLIEPRGIETTDASPLTSRLLDVATGRQIELPLGTAGWR